MSDDNELSRSEQLYVAPDVPPEEVTPLLVRNELLTCFESANREFLKILHQPVDDTILKNQIKQFVAGSFSQCGASFDNPTKQGIINAIGECKKNAEAMMGPRGREVIDHHYREMMKLVEKLND
jgi:hypothetical protein